MSTGTVPEEASAQPLADDTVELHVRNVPRAVWLKARHAALASRLRFGRYVIQLLEQAEPLPPAVSPLPVQGSFTPTVSPEPKA